MDKGFKVSIERSSTDLFMMKEVEYGFSNAKTYKIDRVFVPERIYGHRLTIESCSNIRALFDDLLGVEKTLKMLYEDRRKLYFKIFPDAIDSSIANVKKERLNILEAMNKDLDPFEWGYKYVDGKHCLFLDQVKYSDMIIE